MMKNLFDTRGGIDMIDRCEECNDPIPTDSASGLCGTCEGDAMFQSDEDNE